MEALATYQAKTVDEQNPSPELVFTSKNEIPVFKNPWI
jgi:hypothetical protein